MTKHLGEITKILKDYSGSAINTSIVLVTSGIQQLTTVAAYKCPCVSLEQLGPNCTAASNGPQCATLFNFSYGLSFMLSPAVVLFVAGIAASVRLWKTLTGCLKKTKRYYREWDDYFKTLTTILGQAMISPITWIVITLLDGRYLACAITPLPYDVGRPSAQYPDCKAVITTRTLYQSRSFDNNLRKSQFIGWVLIAVLVVVGIVVYSIIQCQSPLTYYHAKYYKLYLSQEEAEFEDEMKRKAKEEAEGDVKKFLEMRRKKDAWDRIATVNEFRRDEEGLALYSNLHEWTLEEEEKEKEKAAAAAVAPVSTAPVEPANNTANNT